MWFSQTSKMTDKLGTVNFPYPRLCLLTAGIQDREKDPKLDPDHAWKLQLHERLAHLSSRGRRVVTPNSGHNIPDEALESVVKTVRTVFQDPQAASAAERHFRSIAGPQ